MTFEIDLAGRVRTVSVEPVGAAGADGGQFRVVLDGVAVLATACPTGLGLWLVYDSGRTVDAALTPGNDGSWLVQFPHSTLTAEVDARRSRRVQSDGPSRSGDERVTAPMPGRVVRVMVKPGDTVAARQPLVVVEAMKMENELVTSKGGRVKEVAVAEGASVEAGRLLVVIE
jgi:biotin carboxyl carrier protein